MSRCRLNSYVRWCQFSLFMSNDHLIFFKVRIRRTAKRSGLLPILGSRHGAGFNIASSRLEVDPGRLTFSSPIHCCGQTFLKVLRSLDRPSLSWTLGGREPVVIKKHPKNKWQALNSMLPKLKRNWDVRY